MTTSRNRRLRLIPGDAEHVLLTEVYDGHVDAVCTCGREWGPFPIEFLEALSEYHDGAIFA